MKKHIKIFDTTLRDGEQTPRVNLNAQEKLRIAKQLESLGVDVIEAGFAVASPGDFESVKLIAENIEKSTVTSLARAVKKDIEVASEAVKNAKKPRIHTFIATSPIHREYKLKMTKEQILDRVKEMVSYAKSFIDDIEFSSEQLLQLLYLLIKGTIRVDDRYFKGTDEELDLFNSKLEDVEIPLLDFFNYLRSEFNINHNYIIPRWAAILPMIIYLIRRNEINHNYKWSDNYNDEHKKQMKAVHQYFLSSQILDWNTQTMVNEFSRLATESAINQREFPLSEIKAFAVSKNRVGELNENNFTWQPWFALKMLQPGRAFNFTENKPHIDHIFPMNRGIDDEMYQNEVDVLWNFQILPAGVNLYKWNKSPKEFLLAHPELKEKFDFLPNLENEVWNNHIDFIQYRKNLMIKYLKERYDISLNS